MPLRDKRLEPPFRGRVTLHAVVVVIEACEKGSPGGATYRVTHEGLLQRDASLDQSGAYLGHLKDGGVVQVVGEYEDYVGPISGRPRTFFLLGRPGCRGLRR